jgi:hypothetical protein
MKVKNSEEPGGRVVASFAQILSYFFMFWFILFQIIFSKWRKFATKNNSLV